MLLFVREQRRQDGRPGGPAEPFLCLGFATYERHEGERPMAIRWRLGSLAVWFAGQRHDDVLACFAYTTDRERCLITLPS